MKHPDKTPGPAPGSPPRAGRRPEPDSAGPAGSAPTGSRDSPLPGRFVPDTVLRAWRRKGRRFRVGVNGHSMQPLIPDGATVTVQAVEPERVRVGHVAVFRHAGGLVAHRIIRVLNEAGGLVFLEKGDRSLSAGRLPAADLIGVVTEIEGNGSRRRLNDGLACTRADALAGHAGYLVYRLRRGAVALKRAVLGSRPLPLAGPLADRLLLAVFTRLARPAHRPGHPGPPSG